MVFIPTSQEDAVSLLQGGGKKQLSEGTAETGAGTTFDLSGDQAQTPTTTMTAQGGTGQQAVPNQFNNAPQAGSSFQTPGGQSASSVQPSLVKPPVENLFGEEGTTQERLLNPIKTQTEQTGQEVGQLGESFRQAAGPSGQTFQSRGGEATLNQAVAGNYPDTQSQEAGKAAAKGLVNAKYTGPTDLDQQRAAAAQAQIQSLQARGQGLQTGGGLMGTLSAGAPGLTSGMARFEAQNLLQDPEFKRQAEAATESAGGVMSQLLSQRAAAQALATQRANEEDLIQQQARAQLTGQRSDIENDVNQKVFAAQQAQQKQADAYNKFLESGDPRDLQGANTTFDPNALYSPAADQANKARQTYAAIMGDPRYADIAKFDPLGLTITKYANEGYALPNLPGKEGVAPGDQEIVQRLNQGLITRPQFNELVQRQKELESHFAPQTLRNKAGELSTVAPLYFGGGGDLTKNIYQPEDTRSYVSFDPGVSPSKENMSSDEQKTHFNNINDLLDESERLNAAGQAYQAASINGDLQKYLDNEKANLETRAGKLTSANKQWQAMIKSVQRRIDRSHGFAGTVSSIASPILGGGLGESLGNLAGGVSGERTIGEAAKGGLGMINPINYAQMGMNMAKMPITGFQNVAGGKNPSPLDPFSPALRSPGINAPNRQISETPTNPNDLNKTPAEIAARNQNDDLLRSQGLLPGGAATGSDVIDPETEAVLRNQALATPEQVAQQAALRNSLNLGSAADQAIKLKKKKAA